MRRSGGIKFILFAVCLLLLMSFFTLNVFCEMPDGYRDMIDGLGDEVEQYLPDGIYSGDTDDVGEAVEQMTGARFWMSTLYAIAEDELKGAVLLFTRLCGLVVIAAVFSALERSMASGAMSGALRFCTTTAVFAAVIPLAGTALVWLPISIYLWATESLASGLMLLAWGSIVVTGADNLLRPYFLSTGINASMIVLLLSIICSMAVFGPVGVIAGPVMVAIALQAVKESERLSKEKQI